MKSDLNSSARKKYAIAAAIVVIFGAGIFFAVRSDLENFLFPDSPVGQTTSTSTVPAGDLEYSNSRYHFSLSYPSNLQVQTYGGTGEDITVVFQDPTTNEGFQVFVVPYDQKQVSAARFQLDEPSGVMLNSTNIVVDGTTANMFYSTNTTMGDTREVWFIRNGLLYEVTTYKQLDTWLAQIMTTWKFQ